MTIFDFLNQHPGTAIAALAIVGFTIVAAIAAWKGHTL